MVTWALIIICGILCSFITYRSLTEMKKGHINNGAQYVVTIGVLFTFLGISIGLYTFNVEDPSQMVNNISTFIDGMKLAFVTSIVGMIFSMFIKWKQSNLENEGDSQFREGMTNIQAIAEEVRLNTETTRSALAELRKSVEAGGNAVLSAELSNLSDAMKQFIQSSADSQNDMRKLSDSMTCQAQLLEGLSSSLTSSIDDFGNRQEQQMGKVTEAITSMADKLTVQMERLSSDMPGAITRMSDTLEARIEESGKGQMEQLNAMNNSIAAMRESSANSESYSKEMLEKTIAFQQQSMEYDKAQNEILQGNTESIIEMKQSFANFVNDVQKVFGDAVIGALNDSMNRLNDQLETQFGDNFKHLNQAVDKLNDWQAEYKEIVISTTEELKAINEVFTRYIDSVSVQMNENLESMNSSLKVFTDTTSANVAVQNNLNEATASLSDMVTAARNNVDAIEGVFHSFQGLAQDVAASNTKAVQAHADAMESSIIEMQGRMEAVARSNNEQVSLEIAEIAKLVKSFESEILKLRDSAFSVSTDTSNYLREFDDASKDVMSKIRDTIEAFHYDFQDAANKSTEKLDVMFKALGENTDRQQKKAIDTLAGSLAVISGQLVSNYNNLIDKIAQLDSLIAKNGGNR